MSLPPRNSDNRSPKRQRFPPPPPVPEEEEEEEESDESVDDDEEEDYSDDSADEEGDEDEDEEENDVEAAAADAGVGVPMMARRTGGTALRNTVTTEAQSRRSVSISSSSPSSSSSQLSITLKSSDLDCPTCLEPLKGPIYQCRNGHITCSACLNKVHKKCPACRIPIGDIRCRAMERVIESSIVPCCNAIYGCKETSSYGNGSAHEEVCVYVRCFCPLPNCTYTGAYKDLQTHALNTHSWDVENLIPFEFDYAQIFSMNLAKSKTALFQEEKEGDLIVVQAVKGTHGGVCVTVSHIAPSTLGLRNLSCSLAKLNAYTTLRIGLMVKKIQKVREPEEPKEDFLFIPEYMLSDDHLKMQICVGNELSYAHI